MVVKAILLPPEISDRAEQAKYYATPIAYIQAAEPNSRIIEDGDLNIYPLLNAPVAPIGQPASMNPLDRSLIRVWFRKTCG